MEQKREDGQEKLSQWENGRKRVNAILQDAQYRQYLQQNREAEKDRIFCHHDMGHFLDVARIAMLLNETEGYGLDGELIYGAALLHDIGRWKQYQDGTPHEEASALLAPEILRRAGFSPEEADQILSAVRSHRKAAVREERNLNGLLYRADKLSRPCFACQAEAACNWKQDKKNRILVW